MPPLNMISHAGYSHAHPRFGATSRARLMTRLAAPSESKRQARQAELERRLTETAYYEDHGRPVRGTDILGWFTTRENGHRALGNYMVPIFFIGFPVMSDSRWARSVLKFFGTDKIPARADGLTPSQEAGLDHAFQDLKRAGFVSQSYDLKWNKTYASTEKGRRWLQEQQQK